jgi:FtsZ-binding cell division protein ZapB
MRNIIKTLIALFFIIISFLLGKCLNTIEINDSRNQYKNEIDSLKRENSQLKDNTSILQNQIDSIIKIDTISYKSDSLTMRQGVNAIVNKTKN